MNRFRSESSNRRSGRAATQCLRLTLALLWLICGTAWGSGSGADQPTSIRVSVSDEKNQPVPQALVELRADGQVLASASTDDKGQANLTVDHGGKYLLTIRKKDYLNTEAPLQLSGNSAAEQVDVVLTRIALSQQKLEVQATPANPVTEPSKIPAALSPTQAQNTPSKPATLTDVLPLVPGIVRAKDGSVRIAGLGENHSAMLINSVNVTDPATGEFGLTVPIDSVETISVAEMPYLAQYGKFTAGVVTAETRRGGDKWQFSLLDPLPEFRIRSLHLRGLKTASPRLNLSGPIIANRLYFQQGGEYLLNKQAVRTLPFPFNETKATAINSFTQFDYVVSPRQTLTTSFHYAPHSLQHAGLDYFNPQPVTPDASFHESTGAILHRLALGGGVLQSIFAMTRVSSGIQPQGTADMVLNPRQNQGNYFSQEARRATRLEWIENWTPGTLHWHGEHTLQTGFVVGHSENEGEFRARPVLVQDASGRLVQRIDFTGGKSFAVSDTAPAAYAQDHWVLNSHFALDMGVRLEGQTITHTIRGAPRSGFVWTLGPSAATVIRGGIGVFYDSVPLDVYAFSSYPEQVITSYDPSGAILDGPRRYFNVTQQVPRRGFRFVRRSLTTGNFAPYSIAGNLQLERSLTRLVLVRFKYLQSLAEDMLTIQARQIHDRGVFMLGSAGTARIRQFEFTSRIGPKETRQFFFSYVRQHARGDVNDASGYVGNFPFPVVRQDLIASLPSEIPNRFLLWGTYSLPRKFQVMPHVEYRNGFPYQPTNALQQYVSYSGPQYRFPRYFSLDLRISKDIRVSKKHAVRLSTSFLNVTNHFNPLEVHSNLADPLYGGFFGNYHRRVLLDFDFLH